VMLAGYFLTFLVPVRLALGFVMGAVANPLYSLLIAYTNDYLGKDQMAAASAGLIFLNGLGAIFGPLAAGWLMGHVGPGGYFLLIAVLFLSLTIYAGWRMTRRRARGASQGLVVTSPNASALAVQRAMEPRDRAA
jgi:MFS family permease